MLGGLLAVVGFDPAPRDKLLVMSAVSPYRGALRFFADAELAIGVQAIDPDRAFFVSDDWVVAMHGYVHFADRPVGTQSAHTIAERFALEGDLLWPKLRGEHAVVVLNRHQRALTIWRDPMNGRFLHHCQDQSITLIATEIRQLRAVCRTPLTLSRPVLKLLASSYSLPEPRTPYSEVKRFESGVRYQLNAAGAITDQRRLNSVLDRLDPTATKMAPTDVVSETERLVDQAVARTVDAHCNTVYLSGGLDSRLVYAAALRQRGSSSVTALSHRFGTLDCDELPTIEAVHHSLQTVGRYLDYDPAQFEHSFEAMLTRCDYPVFLTSHLTQQLLEVTAANSVVLGGFGGDEIFIANPRAMIDAPITQRWTYRVEVLSWLHSSWKQRSFRGRLEDIVHALTPAAVYQNLRSIRRGQSKLSAEQARLRWFVLQRKHSAHGFYGMLEQLPASYGLDLRIPFRDLDLCAFLQSVHPLGLLQNGDTRGLQKLVLQRYLRLPASLTPQPKVNYTHVVERAIRSWPEMLEQSYRMESAMDAFIERFIARHSS
jgi:asparagine synthetase B (glutamine-hydrolysing)